VTTARDLQERLRSQGERDDALIDLAETAMLLAALDRPEGDLAPYRDHLAGLALQVKSKVPPGAPHPVAEEARALVGVLAEDNGYVGDTLPYDDPQNANLIRVIDRRKGLPVTLSILYIHVARSSGWTATGINFPGHFLIRLEGTDGRIILDPFNGGVERDVSDLRALLKQMAGLDAELTPAHYEPIGNRDTLIRLLNTTKLRAQAAKDEDRVAEILERMLMVAPTNPALLHEAGVSFAQVGNLRRAIETLEALLTHNEDPARRRTVERLLHQIRSRLN
jgi:regulator of sirC expression with transglutaminase-like and TPR domain